VLKPSSHSPTGSPKSCTQVSLWVEVTERCNIRCKFCYNDWRAAQSARWTSIDIEVAEASIHTLASKFDITQVAISGGEPSLYRNLNRLVRFVSNLGIPSILTTNGSSLSRTRLQQLSSAGLHSVQVSMMAGSPQTHDALADSRGAWTKSVRCLVICRELAIPASVVFVVTRTNLHELQSVAQLCRHLGVRVLIINRFIVAGLGLSNRELLELPDAMITAQLEKCVRHNPDLDIILGVPIPSHDRQPAGNFIQRSGAVQLTIGVDGQVRFCSQSGKRYGSASDLGSLNAILRAHADDQSCYCSTKFFGN
jgi:MoaA/NifB/PqqE/SkfB family radical SAM enzyme